MIEVYASRNKNRQKVVQEWWQFESFHCQQSVRFVMRFGTVKNRTGVNGGLKLFGTVLGTSRINTRT